MAFQRKFGLKIQMKCHICKLDCLPKNGDWHTGADSQVFLCRACEPNLNINRPKVQKPKQFAKVTA